MKTMQGKSLWEPVVWELRVRSTAIEDGFYRRAMMMGKSIPRIRLQIQQAIRRRDLVEGA